MFGDLTRELVQDRSAVREVAEVVLERREPCDQFAVQPEGWHFAERQAGPSVASLFARDSR